MAKYAAKKDEQKKHPFLAVASVLTGTGQIARAHRSGALTGRETVYHSTGSKKVDKIKTEGLQHKFSIDPNNFTNTVLKDVPMSKKRGKVYMARNKSMHAGYVFQEAKVRRTNPLATAFQDPIKRLTLRVPLGDIAQHEVVNPELRGATNKTQFFRRAHKNAMRNLPEYRAEMERLPKWRRKLKAMGLKQGYTTLGPKGVLAYQGNIGPENIVGSSKYKATTLQDIFTHVKARPGMFAKGVARTAFGAALVAAPFVASKIKKSRTKGPDSITQVFGSN